MASHLKVSQPSNFFFFVGWAKRCQASYSVCGQVLILSHLIVYAHGRRLCSNWFRHGSTTISYPQCSLTFMRERYLNRCREQSFAIRAYAMIAVGIVDVSVPKLFERRVVITVNTDFVSSHTDYCRIAYSITR